MSYQRGGGQSNKGKNVATSSSFDVDQLNQGVQDVNLGSNEDGGWATYSKKNKNKAGNGAGSNQWASQNPKPNPWGQSDPYRTSGRGNGNVRPPNNARATQMGGRGGFNNQPMNRNHGNNYNPAFNSIRPPLQGGWDRKRDNILFPQPADVEDEAEDHNETEDLDESDDELLSDEYDSDESPKSHEERKKHKWFVEFFTTLDKLTVEQINEPDRQWHCPACKNGPGAIDWYKSLQYLISHAQRIGSKRVKLHRDFAEVLEEELRIKGSTVVAAGESYGQWEGLNEKVKDKEIVWPPMVIIMNTLLEPDENDKGIVKLQYRVVRERTESLHKQNQEEMDSQEQHYNDLLKEFQEARNKEEDYFDKLMQEERRRVDQTFSVADPQKRDEKFEEMKEFEEEREKLMSLHDKRMAELQRKYLEDKVKLEQGFNAELTQLRDKYAPKGMKCKTDERYFGRNVMIVARLLVFLGSSTICLNLQLISYSEWPARMGGLTS
ncbi:protein suppressor of gene silencing 3 [Tanacetum coccineum]|uniref:Protein suppressor of gene silencing 3 n=1 Tax=Tanacetum coccineum TaxID=301880 RepID=A0ABQ5D7W5_9ASTR